MHVHGASMEPTLSEGDRLLVLPAARVRRGDLVVVPDPRVPARLLVKRAASAPDGRGEIILRGDNPMASTDSRQWGPVPVAAVRGRVWYRYAPAPRAGRIG